MISFPDPKTNLSYRIEGEGPPLLLVHGLGVTFTIWMNLAPLLRPYYKLIIVELPGNGASPIPDNRLPYYLTCANELEALRQCLGLPTWNLLGYSLGARVVQTYLSCYPDRVERAIFLCPAFLTRFWGLSMRLLDLLDTRTPGAGSWLLRGWRLPRLVRLLGFNGHGHPYAALWTREIQSQPVQVIKASLRQLPDLDKQLIYLPSKPVKFIWGEHDSIVRHPHIPGPADCFVPGNHSAPMLSAPQIAEVIRQFIPAPPSS